MATQINSNLRLVAIVLPEIGFLGIRNQPKIGFKASWNNAFSLFFAMFFQKNEEKPCHGILRMTLWLRVANYCLFGWPFIPKLDCVCKIF